MANPDTVCPWCYVGHRRLGRAIKQFKAEHPDANHTFNIIWHPYYLNPNAPTEGVPKAAYYKAKFGEARTAMIFERLTKVGAPEGINFSFGGKTGHTRDSHRVIELARQKGKQTAVVEKIFVAAFEADQDITDHNVLVHAAVAGGLDEAETREWLRTDGGRDVVDRGVAQARAKGIDGVPSFTINGQHTIGGAQDPQEFIEIFEFVAN
jgi:predicted DsbA family dithiol-disulfide isomerase